MHILFIGDVLGKPGRRVLRGSLKLLREKLDIDVVIANCENASGGIGIKPAQAEELFSYGVDFLTSGNHVFKHKDIYSYLEAESRIIRPANYPPGVPGRGVGFIQHGRTKIAVINLLGRVFMEPNYDCPFRTADAILASLPDDVKVIIVDFHAEATAEKIALGHYLNGRVSAVLGTHTHVPTADEQILSGGTAYISDVGMTGPNGGVIGMRTKEIIDRFLTGLPVSFQPAKEMPQLNAVLMEIDGESGHARQIQRIRKIYLGP